MDLNRLYEDIEGAAPLSVSEAIKDSKAIAKKGDKKKNHKHYMIGGLCLPENDKKKQVFATNKEFLVDAIKAVDQGHKDQKFRLADIDKPD